MQIMIDISKDDYTYISSLKDGITDYQTTLRLYDAIKKGVPFKDTPEVESQEMSNVDTGKIESEVEVL